MIEYYIVGAVVYLIIGALYGAHCAAHAINHEYYEPSDSYIYVRDTILMGSVLWVPALAARLFFFIRRKF